MYFQLFSLAFGSRSAVHVLNWPARAVQRILLAGFGRIVTNCFDDYPQVESSALNCVP